MSITDRLALGSAMVRLSVLALAFFTAPVRAQDKPPKPEDTVNPLAPAVPIKKPGGGR